MTSTQCAVQSCKISVFNKPPGVTFHPCPTSSEIRNRWLNALKHKCIQLDWSKSRICSKHFETKYFDSSRKLRPNAVPTIFSSNIKQPIHKVFSPKSRIERLLGKKSQTEILQDIQSSMKKLREPSNLDNIINDQVKFRGEVSNEAQLWLIVKKQEHLNKRLQAINLQNMKQIELLQNSVQQYKKRSTDSNSETHKYIVKCLQEKLSTLEEQIEILTAIESR
ncbi:unnamed protein product [Pieris brassicae]|uniref:THAP-type domain-containing protein n=1 Tax=Pieris brassicae TaxID=7116 RepID=A0A9P0TCP6_PIEBR|nr:unnamed protein product [Pieris brassicae]